jgi:hypothetical protein
MDLERARGVSLYSPLGQDHCLRGLYTAQHSLLVQDTGWDEFLAAYWGGNPPPFSVNCIRPPFQPVAYLPVVLSNYP